MDDSEPWRNQRSVKVIAALDIILASVLIILYFYYGIVFMTGAETFPGDFPVSSARLLSFVFALVAICVNILQAYIAAKLFQALKQVEPYAQDCIRQGRYWFKGSLVFVFLLIVKLFILSLFSLGDSNALDFVFCFLEALLRTVGLYCVKELMDDLKAEASRGMPRSISIVLMSDLMKKYQDLEDGAAVGARAREEDSD